jgi:hypothetical protein
MGAVSFLPTGFATPLLASKAIARSEPAAPPLRPASPATSPTRGEGSRGVGGTTFVKITTQTLHPRGGGWGGGAPRVAAPEFGRDPCRTPRLRAPR